VDAFRTAAPALGWCLVTGTTAWLVRVASVDGRKNQKKSSGTALSSTAPLAVAGGRDPSRAFDHSGYRVHRGSGVGDDDQLVAATEPSRLAATRNGNDTSVPESPDLGRADPRHLPGDNHYFARLHQTPTTRTEPGSLRHLKHAPAPHDSIDDKSNRCNQQHPLVHKQETIRIGGVKSGEVDYYRTTKGDFL
jgi:hypothetical protein